MKNSDKLTDQTLAQTVESMGREVEKLRKHLYLAKEMLTLEEAAAFLGVSKSSLYKMTHARAIPYYKPNNKLVYFDRSELTGWLRRCRVASDEELDERAKDWMRFLASK